MASSLLPKLPKVLAGHEDSSQSSYQSENNISIYCVWLEFGDGFYL